MFDSYDVRPNQSIKINAVTGAILKNHHKSWFERFHLCSQRANRLLSEGGDKATKKEYDNDAWNSNGRTVRDPENDIIVLQMVICGDMEVMAELIYRKDYEEAKGGE
jgi:hypothetical protein